MPAPAVTPRAAPSQADLPARGVPVTTAVPALLARLAHVQRALTSDEPAPDVPGFGPVPDAPPSRRERALLVQFAWVAYTVLAGRPPAARPPAAWPWHVVNAPPLGALRPDVLPTLTRVLDRVLTAPPLAPLPSITGIEELLRRAVAKAAPTERPATPAEGVIVAIELRPNAPEPAPAVIARLRVLASVLAGASLSSPIERRRGLFRLGWTGWERLTGSPPWESDIPYVLQLGSARVLQPPRAGEAPDELWRLLSSLLDESPSNAPLSIAEVAAQLARMANDASEHSPGSALAPSVTPALLATGVVEEATRLLDALAASGLVRPGASASVARSLDERLAVTGLAWGVYRALTGASPVVAGLDGALPYVPVAHCVPQAAGALADVVDSTLAPSTSADVPGLASWIIAAESAAVGAVFTNENAPAAAASSPPIARAQALPRRKLDLLPHDGPSRHAPTPWLPWVVGGAAAAAVWWLSVPRAFGGP